jgi:3-hydroxyisobutyrate dehydrogenase-like beta-hydroxyacid dehydrogenase
MDWTSNRRLKKASFEAAMGLNIVEDDQTSCSCVDVAVVVVVDVAAVADVVAVDKDRLVPRSSPYSCTVSCSVADSSFAAFVIVAWALAQSSFDDSPTVVICELEELEEKWHWVFDQPVTDHFRCQQQQVESQV